MKALDPTGWVNSPISASDSSFLYSNGGSADPLITTRYPVSTIENGDVLSLSSTAFTFPGGRTLATRYVWNLGTLGECYILVKVITGGGDSFELWYSTDGNIGTPITLAEETIALTDGTQGLDRCMARGFFDGVETDIFVEYNGDFGGNVKVWMKQKSVSSAWVEKADMSFSSIRHWHGVTWDEDENCFWLFSGDDNAKSMILKYPPTSGSTFPTIPDALPATLRDTHGFTLVTGDQHSRAVDVIPDGDFIYTFSDATDEAALGVNKGIWRWDKDLTNPLRIDVGDLYYDEPFKYTGWTGLKVGNQQIWVDNSGGATVPDQQRMVTIYGVEGSNVEKIGAFYVATDSTQHTVKYLGVTPSGIIYLNVLEGGRGKLASGNTISNNTALFRLSNDDFFREEIAPSRTLDGQVVPTTNIPIVHPTFTVNAATGSNLNQARFPFEAFADLEHALTDDNVTYGCNIKVVGTIPAASGTISLNFNSFPDGGGGSDGQRPDPVQINGTDAKAWIETWIGSGVVQDNAGKAVNVSPSLQLLSLQAVNMPFIGFADEDTSPVSGDTFAPTRGRQRAGSQAMIEAESVPNGSVFSSIKTNVKNFDATDGLVARMGLYNMTTLTPTNHIGTLLAKTVDFTIPEGASDYAVIEAALITPYVKKEGDVLAVMFVSDVLGDLGGTPVFRMVDDGLDPGDCSEDTGSNGVLQDPTYSSTTETRLQNPAIWSDYVVPGGQKAIVGSISSSLIGSMIGSIVN